MTMHRSQCVDVSNNTLYCGSCDVTCDSFTQICVSGTCTCDTGRGFYPCETKGFRCLDTESCPPGSVTYQTFPGFIDPNTDSSTQPLAG
jgi:hypothetical protein